MPTWNQKQQSSKSTLFPCCDRGPCFSEWEVTTFTIKLPPDSIGGIIKPNSKFPKPTFHSVKPLKNNYMFSDSCILLRLQPQMCTRPQGWRSLLKGLVFYIYNGLNFLGNRGSFFVKTKQFACTLCMKKSEEWGTGREQRVKTDPLRQWCTCSTSSIFCSALTEQQAPDETEMWSLITAAVKTKWVAPTTTAHKSSCSFS